MFDVESDVAESKNVAADNVDIANRMIAALEAWNKELIEPVFPGSSVKNEDWGPGGANQKNAPNKKPGNNK